jgi:hypothetical protein
MPEAEILNDSANIIKTNVRKWYISNSPVSLFMRAIYKEII